MRVRLNVPPANRMAAVRSWFVVAGVLAVAACSSGDSVAEAPTFDEPDVVTTAPVADVTVEDVGVAPDPLPTPTSVVPVAEPADSDIGDDSAAVGVPVPLTLDEVDLEVILPAPEDTVWKSAEFGYEPSGDGEIPVITYRIPPPMRSAAICYNEQANPASFFISTSEGIVCGMELMSQEGEEHMCEQISPGSRFVELDPHLSFETLEGELMVRTKGCAFAVTEEGLDRHTVEASSADG